MPEAENLESDMTLLYAAAKEAGRIAMGYFRQDPQIWIKNDTSPVTEADLAVDTYLKEFLLRERPHYGWISEETADDRDACIYERSFVVDPIDGTRGFIDGSQEWCISIAIIENGVPVSGVLECPVKGHFYQAIKNGGVQMNGKAISVEKTDGHSPMLSCTSSLARKLPKDIKETFEISPYIPSLAYRLALAARGKLDVVLVRPNCHDWDIAAADLIMSEAGGVLCDLEGQRVQYGERPYSHDFLIAAAEPEIKNMIDIVRAHQLG